MEVKFEKKMKLDGSCRFNPNQVYFFLLTNSNGRSLFSPFFSSAFKGVFSCELYWGGKRLTSGAPIAFTSIGAILDINTMYFPGLSQLLLLASGLIMNSPWGFVLLKAVPRSVFSLGMNRI